MAKNLFLKTRVSFATAISYINRFAYEARRQQHKMAHTEVLQDMTDTLSLALGADRVTYYDRDQYGNLRAHTANTTTEASADILAESHVQNVAPEGPLKIVLDRDGYVFIPTIRQPDKYYLYDRNGFRIVEIQDAADNPLNPQVTARYEQDFGNTFNRSEKDMSMLFGCISVPGTKFGAFKIDSFPTGRSVLPKDMDPKNLLQIAALAGNTAAWIIDGHLRMVELNDEKAKAELLFNQARNILMEIKHAFRNRLGPIRGYVGMALAGKMAEMVLKKTMQLLDETEAFLESYVKPVEQGSFESQVHLAPADVRPIFEDLALQAQQEGYVVKIAPEIPIINTDIHAVYNILHGLIDNAKKYSSNGAPIQITCGPNASKLKISVADQGFGLAPGDEIKIFKGGIRRHPQIPGSGRGLEGYKRIAEKLGGNLRAESPGIGKGSTFTLTLPI